jgi:hypothetical protein
MEPIMVRIGKGGSTPSFPVLSEQKIPLCASRSSFTNVDMETEISHLAIYRGARGTIAKSDGKSETEIETESRYRNRNSPRNAIPPAVTLIRAS